MNTRRIDANGLDFKIIEAGVGQADHLLLVHGFTGASEDFEDHIDALADRGWHVVAPDHRGHGESAKPAGEDSYSMAIMAGDMIAIVDALGWESFVLLGHSMGGMVAQHMAADHTQRLRGLILMDTSPVVPDGLDPDALAAGVALVRSSGLEPLVQLQNERGAVLDTPAHQRMVATRPGYKEQGERKTLASSPEMWAAIATEIVHQPDRLDRLGAVDVPALVIVGEQDAPFMVHSENMAKTLPQGTLAVIPDAGHSPQYEAAEPWFAALTAFLDEVKA